jgi:hypothetical protein
LFKLIARILSFLWEQFLLVVGVFIPDLHWLSFTISISLSFGIDIAALSIALAAALSPSEKKALQIYLLIMLSA